MVQIVAKFFVAKIVKKCTKNYEKSSKIEKIRPKAPKSAQERHKALGPQPCPALGAVLSRSWGALGRPRTRPGPSKTRPGAPKCAPKANFNVFSRIFFFTSRLHPLERPRICNPRCEQLLQVSPKEIPQTMEQVWSDQSILHNVSRMEALLRYIRHDVVLPQCKVQSVANSET